MEIAGCEVRTVRRMIQYTPLHFLSWEIVWRNAPRIWRDFGSALPFQTRLTQTKPVLPLSIEYGSQVKDQGRRQCCYNKHNKFPYRPTRGVSLFSGHASYLPLTGWYKNSFHISFGWSDNLHLQLTSTDNPPTDPHFHVLLRSTFLLNWSCGPSSDKQRQGHETDNSPSRTAEVRNEWSNTSVPPYAFIIRTGITSPLPGPTLRVQWRLLLWFTTKRVHKQEVQLLSTKRPSVKHRHQYCVPAEHSTLQSIQ